VEISSSVTTRAAISQQHTSATVLTVVETGLTKWTAVSDIFTYLTVALFGNCQVATSVAWVYKHPRTTATLLDSVSIIKILDFLSRLRKMYTVSQKNVPPLTGYNLDIHYPIVRVFGRSVNEKLRNQTIYCFSITLRMRKPRRQNTGALCVQHSPTATALSISFLLNHAPNSPEPNALIARLIVSHTAAWVW